MKKPFNGIPDYRKKTEKPEVEEMPLKTCMVCKKPTLGYGMFREGVVCSRKCNETYEKNRPSLIDYVIGENHESSHRSVPRADDADSKS